MAVLTKVTIFVSASRTIYSKVAPKVALENDNVEKHEVAGKNGFFLPADIDDVISDAVLSDK